MSFPLPESNPEALGLDPRPLDRLCALIERHIAENRHPGAQLAVARHGKLALFRTYGDAKTEGSRVPATNDFPRRSRQPSPAGSPVGDARADGRP